MKNVIVCCALCLLLFARVCSAQDKLTVPPNFSRSDFAARMAKVKEGMTQEEVTALLGPPDVVTTQIFFPYGSDRDSSFYGRNTWLYGVTPKSGCPTLGDITFDKDKKVLSVRGNEGQPPPESLISEAKLRELLELFYGLRKWWGIDGYNFDPLVCIKAVNTLQPYGKERVLAAVEEYHRVFGLRDRYLDKMDDRLLVVLRVLFDTHDNRSFVLAGIEAPNPPAPLDTTLIPLFPILPLDDVPFFLVYWDGGRIGTFVITDTFLPFLEDLKKNGQIRKTPLRPPSDPLALFDKLLASNQWLCGKTYPVEQYRGVTQYSSPNPYDETVGRQIAMIQLLRLVHTVIPAASPYRTYLETDEVYWSRLTPTEWPRIRAELSKLSIRWNPKKNDYEVH